MKFFDAPTNTSLYYNASVLNFKGEDKNSQKLDDNVSKTNVQKCQGKPNKTIERCKAGWGQDSCNQGACTVPGETGFKSRKEKICSFAWNKYVAFIGLTAVGHDHESPENIPEYLAQKRENEMTTKPLCMHMQQKGCLGSQQHCRPYSSSSSSSMLSRHTCSSHKTGKHKCHNSKKKCYSSSSSSSCACSKAKCASSSSGSGVRKQHSKCSYTDNNGSDSVPKRNSTTAAKGDCSCQGKGRRLSKGGSKCSLSSRSSSRSRKSHRRKSSGRSKGCKHNCKRRHRRGKGKSCSSSGSSKSSKSSKCDLGCKNKKRGCDTDCKRHKGGSNANCKNKKDSDSKQDGRGCGADCKKESDLGFKEKKRGSDTDWKNGKDSSCKQKRRSSSSKLENEKDLDADHEKKHSCKSKCKHSKSSECGDRRKRKDSTCSASTESPPEHKYSTDKCRRRKPCNCAGSSESSEEYKCPCEKDHHHQKDKRRRSSTHSASSYDSKHTSSKSRGKHGNRRGSSSSSSGSAEEFTFKKLKKLRRITTTSRTKRRPSKPKKLQRHSTYATDNCLPPLCTCPRPEPGCQESRSTCGQVDKKKHKQEPPCKEKMCYTPATKKKPLPLYHDVCDHSVCVMQATTSENMKKQSQIGVVSKTTEKQSILSNRRNSTSKRSSKTSVGSNSKQPTRKLSSSIDNKQSTSDVRFQSNKKKSNISVRSRSGSNSKQPTRKLSSSVDNKQSASDLRFQSNKKKSNASVRSRSGSNSKQPTTKLLSSSSSDKEQSASGLKSKSNKKKLNTSVRSKSSQNNSRRRPSTSSSDGSKKKSTITMRVQASRGSLRQKFSASFLGRRLSRNNLKKKSNTSTGTQASRKSSTKVSTSTSTGAQSSRRIIKRPSSGSTKSKLSSNGSTKSSLFSMRSKASKRSIRKRSNSSAFSKRSRAKMQKASNTSIPQKLSAASNKRDASAQSSKTSVGKSSLMLCQIGSSSQKRSKRNADTQMSKTSLKERSKSSRRSTPSARRASKSSLKSTPSKNRVSKKKRVKKQGICYKIGQRFKKKDPMASKINSVTSVGSKSSTKGKRNSAAKRNSGGIRFCRPSEKQMKSSEETEALPSKSTICFNCLHTSKKRKRSCSKERGTKDAKALKKRSEEVLPAKDQTATEKRQEVLKPSVKETKQKVSQKQSRKAVRHSDSSDSNDSSDSKSNTPKRNQQSKKNNLVFQGVTSTNQEVLKPAVTETKRKFWQKQDKEAVSQSDSKYDTPIHSQEPKKNDSVQAVTKKNQEISKPPVKETKQKVLQKQSKKAVPHSDLSDSSDSKSNTPIRSQKSKKNDTVQAVTKTNGKVPKPPVKETKHKFWQKQDKEAVSQSDSKSDTPIRSQQPKKNDSVEAVTKKNQEVLKPPLTETKQKVLKKQSKKAVPHSDLSDSSDSKSDTPIRSQKSKKNDTVQAVTKKNQEVLKPPVKETKHKFWKKEGKEAVPQSDSKSDTPIRSQQPKKNDSVQAVTTPLVKENKQKVLQKQNKKGVHHSDLSDSSDSKSDTPIHSQKSKKDDTVQATTKQNQEVLKPPVKETKHKFWKKEDKEAVPQSDSKSDTPIRSQQPKKNDSVQAVTTPLVKENKHKDLQKQSKKAVPHSDPSDSSDSKSGTPIHSQKSKKDDTVQATTKHNQEVLKPPVKETKHKFWQKQDKEAVPQSDSKSDTPILSQQYKKNDSVQAVTTKNQEIRAPLIKETKPSVLQMHSKSKKAVPESSSSDSSDSSDSKSNMLIQSQKSKKNDTLQAATKKNQEVLKPPVKEIKHKYWQKQDKEAVAQSDSKSDTPIPSQQSKKNDSVQPVTKKNQEVLKPPVKEIKKKALQKHRKEADSSDSSASSDAMSDTPIRSQQSKKNDTVQAVTKKNEEVLKPPVKETKHKFLQKQGKDEVPPSDSKPDTPILIQQSKKNDSVQPVTKKNQEALKPPVKEIVKQKALQKHRKEAVSSDSSASSDSMSDTPIRSQQSKKNDTVQAVTKKNEEVLKPPVKETKHKFWQNHDKEEVPPSDSKPDTPIRSQQSKKNDSVQPVTKRNQEVLKPPVKEVKQKALQKHRKEAVSSDSSDSSDSKPYTTFSQEYYYTVQAVTTKNQEVLKPLVKETKQKVLKKQNKEPVPQCDSIDSKADTEIRSEQSKTSDSIEAIINKKSTGSTQANIGPSSESFFCPKWRVLKKSAPRMTKRASVRAVSSKPSTGAQNTKSNSSFCSKQEASPPRMKTVRSQEKTSKRRLFCRVSSQRNFNYESDAKESVSKSFCGITSKKSLINKPCKACFENAGYIVLADNVTPNVSRAKLNRPTLSDSIENVSVTNSLKLKPPNVEMSLSSLRTSLWNQKPSSIYSDESASATIHQEYANNEFPFEALFQRDKSFPTKELCGLSPCSSVSYDNCINEFTRAWSDGSLILSSENSSMYDMNVNNRLSREKPALASTSNNLISEIQTDNKTVKRVYHYCTCGQMMRIEVVKS